MIAFFLEAGLALMVVPWTGFWDRNYFGHALPFVRDVITNNFVRGAITGIGLINIWIGIAELIGLLLARHPETLDLRGTTAATDEQG